MKNIQKQVVFFLLACILAGCGTLKMAVPSDIASMDKEELVATDRSRASGAFVNESFKLGPYSISDVDRDWNTDSNFGIGVFSKEKSTSGYSYVFHAQSGDQKGVCQIEGNKKSVGLGLGVEMSKESSSFGCVCETEGAKTQVILSSQNYHGYKGTYNTPTQEYAIEAIYEIEGSGSTGNPSGYRIDSDAPVAAAEVLYPGTVWLAKDLDAQQKANLTCIMSGLMLYKGKSEF